MFCASAYRPQPLALLPDGRRISLTKHGRGASPRWFSSCSFCSRFPWPLTHAPCSSFPYVRRPWAAPAQRVGVARLPKRVDNLAGLLLLLLWVCWGVWSEWGALAPQSPQTGTGSRPPTAGCFSY